MLEKKSSANHRWRCCRWSEAEYLPLIPPAGWRSSLSAWRPPAYCTVPKSVPGDPAVSGDEMRATGRNGNENFIFKRSRAVLENAVRKSEEGNADADINKTAKVICYCKVNVQTFNLKCGFIQFYPSVSRWLCPSCSSSPWEKKLKDSLFKGLNENLNCIFFPHASLSVPSDAWIIPTLGLICGYTDGKLKCFSPFREMMCLVIIISIS